MLEYDDASKVIKSLHKKDFHCIYGNGSTKNASTKIFHQKVWKRFTGTIDFFKNLEWPNCHWQTQASATSIVIN